MTIFVIAGSCRNNAFILDKIVQTFFALLPTIRDPQLYYRTLSYILNYCKIETIISIDIQTFIQQTLIVILAIEQNAFPIEVLYKLYQISEKAFLSSEQILWLTNILIQKPGIFQSSLLIPILKDSSKLIAEHEIIQNEEIIEILKQSEEWTYKQKLWISDLIITIILEYSHDYYDTDITNIPKDFLDLVNILILMVYYEVGLLPEK